MSWFTKSAQFQNGKKYERELDGIFSERGWHIQQTTDEQERSLKLGDRIFSRDGESLYVEYKSDETASRTGNAFVETISVDTDCTPGWVYTCQADWLFYYLPLDGLIYAFRPDELRRLLPKWEKKYPTRSTSGQSKGYNTHGILVPLHEFEQHANQVINL